MNDLALGLIVLTVAAVPASLLVLAVADVIHLPDAERRNRWINRCLAALAVPALGVLGVLVWGWAGAAHLGPLCAAYATPEYRHARALEIRSLLVDSDQTPEPPWVAGLLGTAGGPLDFVEYRPAQAVVSPQEATLDEPMTGQAARSDSLGSQSAYVLEVRRRTHHRNRWFTVEMDRFSVRDRGTGAVLAEGDELWIRAGRATYHCGIGSGPEPTADTPWPGGSGVASFIARLGQAPRDSPALR